MSPKFYKPATLVLAVLVSAHVAAAQNTFKVWAECARSCDQPDYPKIMHFEYGGGVQITTDASSVAATANNFQTSKQFQLNFRPSNHFTDASGNAVNATLNAILLRVHNLGKYCDQRNVKGTYSETGRFLPLAELRRNLRLGANASSVDTNDWDSFWTAFRSAVRRRDRRALKSMMIPDFEWSFGLYPPGDRRDTLFRSLDRYHNWTTLDRVLAQGAVPRFESGEELRIARLGPSLGSWRAGFKKVNGHWRWTFFVSGD